MFENKNWTFELEEYIKQGEPEKYEKNFSWNTAIGLQAVDGLKTSPYLLELAKKNIDGDITLEQTEQLINQYYTENPTNDRTEEADKVSTRIAYLLSQKSFSLTSSEYISIHKYLFQGIYDYAGTIRKHNITKKEWILDNDTVLYGSFNLLKETLEYDLEQERIFNYKGLTTNEIIKHLASFISRLWQIHIFGEGNTRTTAVFFIKYLRKLGFDFTNDMFANHSWYFRNSMVRANYSNLKLNVHETTEYLELFLRNLLLNEKNELKNRTMHIRYNTLINSKEERKPDVFERKPDVLSFEVIYEMIPNIRRKTKDHIKKLYESFETSTVFTRKNVMIECHLGESSASELLNKLYNANIIEHAGSTRKYRFKISIKR